MVSGLIDPIARAETAEPLAEQLRAVGAALRHERIPAGHGLTAADLRLARSALAG
jgi:phospholipase/carboxylesterase